MERCSSNDEREFFFSVTTTKMNITMDYFHIYYMQDIGEALRATSVKELPKFSPLMIQTKLSKL